MKVIHLTTLLLFMLLLKQADAQFNTFSLYLNNGTVTNYSLSNIQNINFSTTDLMLEETNGTSSSWQITDIRKYLYTFTTNINSVSELDANVSVYPNPYQEKFSLKYNLKEQGKTIIKLLSIDGREIETLVSKEENKGSYTIEYDNSTLIKGIYFIHIQLGDKLIVKRIVKLN